MDRIYCGNPLKQYLKYQKAINQTILKTLKNGIYILGKQVELFEQEFAHYIGVKFGIGVSSGTEALYIALKACGVDKGDEVITVSHTAVATVVAIELCGARPVLVDIEPSYFTLDPAKLKKAISHKTKAIIPVHLYGQAVDLKPILKIAQRYGVKVIEDCAQAHGTGYMGKKVGSWGDVGCFSFYPTKNLGAIGDGGMIVTNNKKIASQCRLLREYGWRKRYVSEISGWNSRLDELQAAILRVKLKYLEKDNKKRIKLASYYTEQLHKSNLILPKQRKNSVHVYHLYVVRAKKRNQLKKFLEKNQIFPLIHYPMPIHLQPAYKGRIKMAGNLSATELIAKEILSLPLYPELKNKEIKIISQQIKFFLNEV
jgi:dTDP-4-amino-4,6-dideoxygalactose transaminase